MKHYWEVDIGLSESARKFDLGWPWTGHFKVTKVKMARIVLSVAPMPKVHIDTNVHHHTVSKSASWPLTLINLYGSLQGHTQIWHWMTFTGLFQDHESEKRMWRLTARLPSDTYLITRWPLDRQLDWFGATSRPSQQQLGFLFYSAFFQFIIIFTASCLYTYIQSECVRLSRSVVWLFRLSACSPAPWPNGAIDLWLNRSNSLTL